MKPTIGRIVHFTPFENKAQMKDLTVTCCNGRFLDDIFLKENVMCETLAGIITMIENNGGVHLQIFFRSEIYPLGRVPFSETPKPGHWNWPPRV